MRKEQLQGEQWLRETQGCRSKVTELLVNFWKTKSPDAHAAVMKMTQTNGVMSRVSFEELKKEILRTVPPLTDWEKTQIVKFMTSALYNIDRRWVPKSVLNEIFGKSVSHSLKSILQKIDIGVRDATLLNLLSAIFELLVAFKYHHSSFEVFEGTLCNMKKLNDDIKYRLGEQGQRALAKLIS